MKGRSDQRQSGAGLISLLLAMAIMSMGAEAFARNSACDPPPGVSRVLFDPGTRVPKNGEIMGVVVATGSDYLLVRVNWSKDPRIAANALIKVATSPTDWVRTERIYLVLGHLQGDVWAPAAPPSEC